MAIADVIGVDFTGDITFWEPGLCTDMKALSGPDTAMVPDLATTKSRLDSEAEVQQEWL